MLNRFFRREASCFSTVAALVVATRVVAPGRACGMSDGFPGTGSSLACNSRTCNMSVCLSSCVSRIAVVWLSVVGGPNQCWLLLPSMFALRSWKSQCCLCKQSMLSAMTAGLQQAKAWACFQNDHQTRSNILGQGHYSFWQQMFHNRCDGSFLARVLETEC